jgi:hypothetical protein
MSSEHLQNVLAFHLPAPPHSIRPLARLCFFIALGWHLKCLESS